MTPTGRLLPVVVAGLVAIAVCSAANIPAPAKRKVCGTKLIELVSKVCNGCVKGPDNMVMTKLEKKRQQLFRDRFLPSMRHLPWDELIESDPTDDQSTLLTGSAPRTKRGIVEECCHKSCSMTTLKEYCAPSC